MDTATADPLDEPTEPSTPPEDCTPEEEEEESLAMTESGTGDSGDGSAAPSPPKSGDPGT